VEVFVGDKPPIQKAVLENLLQGCSKIRAWYPADIALQIWRIAAKLRRKLQEDEERREMYWSHEETVDFLELKNLLMKGELEMENSRPNTPVLSE
jgi:hypothetical protein